MKKINNHLVCGLGEVGFAIAKVFEADGIDKDQKADQKSYKYVHICIPYSKHFQKIVEDYQDQYAPEFTIIHSTVPPGTSSKLNAIHSPVLGIHPFLEQGIRTFVKMLGGENASYVADEFRRHGLRVHLFDKSETTEIMKILDTTFYGVCIDYTKHVKEVCQDYDIPFEAWHIWTNNYNTGYNKLGFPEYTRPNLVPIMTKQGGHCTIPNCDLLETTFTRLLKELNEKW